MKSILKTFSVALLSAILTLFLYTRYSLTPETTITSSDQKVSILPTTYTYASKKVAAELTDFTKAAEKTVHAVVHVKNTSIKTEELPSFYRYFYGLEGESSKRIGSGSGVIVSPDGYIITNNHVIEDNTEIEVTTNNNKSYIAKLVGTDPTTDIAVLKIDAKEALPYVFFGDSDAAKVGEWVLAVGNPFNLNSTVTAGIISAKSRDIDPNDEERDSYIQTDAAVNQGNSGGALVNTQGELIGINTAITSISGGFVGYSFAVPSNVARKVFEDILEFGETQKGLLGVSGVALNSQLAEQFQVEDTQGFYIRDMEAGLGAELAGLRAGDIIKKVDEIEVKTFADLSGYLASKRPGESVNVTFKRGNSEKTATVRLEKISSAYFYYMELRDLKPEQMKAFDTDHGVFISGMNNRWLLNSGIDEGDLIVEINRTPVKNIDDLKTYSKDALSSITFLNKEGDRILVPIR